MDVDDPEKLLRTPSIHSTQIHTNPTPPPLTSAPQKDALEEAKIKCVLDSPDDRIPANLVRPKQKVPPSSPFEGGRTHMYDQADLLLGIDW